MNNEDSMFNTQNSNDEERQQENDPDNEMSIQEFQEIASDIHAEIKKVIIGQPELINDLVVTLLAGGNALLEGVPGLGKTMLIRALANVVDCSFGRIQFTPDLMPADITGTMIISEVSGHRSFRFEKGPIFANIILADEINRAAPRTQSALLEAMQEQRVTISGESHILPQPFFVLATQNPIEMAGTYPLPEAQLDRFLYKIIVSYPDEDELIEIARLTTGKKLPKANRITNGKGLLEMQVLVKEVPVSMNAYRYAACLVGATHPDTQDVPEAVQRHVNIGASPRGVQSLIWSSKVEALLDNRKAVALEDIQKVAYPALRHRMILKFEAIAEGIHPDSIIDEVISETPKP